MKTELEFALQTLEAYNDSPLAKQGFLFYQSLLEEEISLALEKLSFLECCGQLSVYYGDNRHYPDLVDGDIYTYLREYEDYHLPLGLLLLSVGQISTFYVKYT